MANVPSHETIKRFVTDSGIAELGGNCDALTLSVQAEFWRIVTGDGVDWPYGRDMRKANIVQQIFCNPTNGMAWADYADLEVNHKGWSQKATEILALSQRYSPFEGDALKLRLSILGRMDEADQANHLQLFEKDINNAIQFASPKSAALFLTQLRGKNKQWGEMQLASLALGRRSAIEREMKASLRPAASE